ncbi:MAG: amino acid ABC transporter permease [Clostridia bacterium]|nr:amino acid ABC transporter permease [Clostridia bacterium]
MDIKVAWSGFVEQLITYGGWKKVVEGLGNTLLIAVVGLAIGIFIGTLLAVTKVVPQKKWHARTFSKLTDIYVGFFRGTPIVVQLLVMYYVILPLIGKEVPAVIVAVIVFGMNSGAYICEIMRSGIMSVDIGQMEAGRALGLNYCRTMTSIIFPQAVKNILPTLGNEFIALVKETSVVSFITVLDLTNAFSQIGTGSYEYVIPYLVLALCYLVIVFIFTVLVRLLERRLRASEKR